MATLVLSTVGTMFGGPLGGALGSLVGQAIDQQLFGPPPRRGPRLGDLAVQTSSYGTPIPKLFGTMRVAGTVVWATDLKEEETIQGGGKSGPEVISYAYSASFAVALSSRRAARIGRIWADGKLLRGAAGDFKVACAFRFHPGGEDQDVDPLIASIEGTGGAPAFRGLAVAVFENLALVEYGNRIPMLTFELVADEADVPVARILGDVSEGLIESANARPLVGGFAAYGSDQRATLSDLVDVWDVGISEFAGKLLADDGPLAAVNSEDRGCATGDGNRNGEERSQDPAKSLPSSLAISYHDAARDYQAGQMRAIVAGGGRSQWRIDCPVVLDAAEAKLLANSAMSRRWSSRDRMTLHLPPRFLELSPGTLLEVEGVAGRWLVDEVTIEGLVVIAGLRRAIDESGPLVAADPGRGTKEPDDPIGRTELALFDLPITAAGQDGMLTLSLAASSAGAFKPVPVSLNLGGQPAGFVSATRRAKLGGALTTLPAANPLVIDRLSSLDVSLYDPAQILLNADAEALSRDANLCVVGQELLQFGRAQDLGGGRFRLSHLLRGRYATEWAVHDHQADEHFMLIDPAAMVPVSLGAAALGGTLEAIGHGIGDDPIDPPVTRAVVSGEAHRPLSPAHLDAGLLNDGSLEVRWNERTRTAFAWVDGTPELPLEGRTFEVTVFGPGGNWSTTTTARGVGVPAGALSALGAGSLTVEVREIGTVSRSRAAKLIVSL